MIEKIREELNQAADPEYKKFHESLVPGLTTMLGVRMPALRKIAKKIAKDDFTEFLRSADDSCYEELMLEGIVIGYAKMSKEEQAQALEIFVPKINNWAICDCCCITYKFMKEDPSYWFSFLAKYLASSREYELRFAIVSILNFFVTDEYLEAILDIFNRIKNDAYYVRMAVAWAVSVCYVSYPERTLTFLQKDTMDAFTHNKSIQKIRESNQVSKEEKDRLLSWKREG